jgi:anti-sigma regulatory factor (Ser/Thr protein kinase)
MSQLVLTVAETSQVGEARRRAAALAQPLGFDETAAGKLALAVTEIATNLVKHAGGGEMLLQPLGREGAAGMELIAVDKGPGMANVAESLRDGHSTAGSSGTGLGSLLRAAPGLEIYSQPGKGTVLRCEIWPGRPPRDGQLEAGAVAVPKRGETVSGDEWTLLWDKGRYTMMIADGLGHGPDAAAAARAATSVLSRNQGSPEQLIDAMHRALASTRGAAAAVAVMQPAKHALAYAGIGNISGVIRHAQKSRHLISHNGILGHQVRKIQELGFPFPESSLLIMHSDGLSARWDLDQYPGLEAKHPGVIAAVLYRDHGRDRDDVTVAVARNAKAG